MARTVKTKISKEVQKRIGKNIAFYRRNSDILDEYTGEPMKITQEKLAELTDKSYSMISNVESEGTEQGMGIAFLESVAEALNIPLYALFLERPIKNPPKDPFEE